MKTIYICVILVAQIVTETSIYGQNYESRKDIIRDMMSEDTDVVILNNERYLINKSFLVNFSGYKSVFPEIEKAEISYGYGAGSPDYDMNYSPYWMIQGDSIFLIGVSLNSDEGRIEYGKYISYDFQLPYERFTRMEKLVKRKFEKTKEPLVNIICMPSKFSCGKLFAYWVTDIYYIKPVMVYDYDVDTWEKEPILKLTIKDGKIIKTEKV